ncbi:MAG TPA: zf-HC2 domain-containing protein, partial [Actinomycetes bacterium]|nr:zf-HC2 domain-containing protein [Actinomycetes bacterium]
MPDRPVHPDREELAAWQAGALSEPAGASVEAHLAGCAECAAVVLAVEDARTALASLEEPELPPGLHERLAAAVDREAAALSPERETTQTRVRAMRPRARHRRVAVLGTAAALILL